MLLGLIVLLAQVRSRLLAGRRVERAVTWDCGYVAPTPRMQYTSSSFARPLVLLFRLFLRPRDEIHPPQGCFPKYAALQTHAPDVFRAIRLRTAVLGGGLGGLETPLAARGADPGLCALHRADDSRAFDLETRLNHVHHRIDCSRALRLLLAPLMPGVINRVKAWFAGRRGPPLLQAYYDLWKLLQKGAVYSKTATWVFVAGPIVGLACAATALLIVPLGSVPGLVAFPGDFLLVAYLLGLMRFFTIIAALDTGSSFEGMGASREAFFSALAEPALLLGLAALIAQTHGVSLSAIYARNRAWRHCLAGPDRRACWWLRPC